MPDGTAPPQRYRCENPKSRIHSVISTQKEPQFTKCTVYSIKQLSCCSGKAVCNRPVDRSRDQSSGECLWGRNQIPEASKALCLAVNVITLRSNFLVFGGGLRFKRDCEVFDHNLSTKSHDEQGKCNTEMVRYNDAHSAGACVPFQTFVMKRRNNNVCLSVHNSWRTAGQILIKFNIAQFY
jgi:hypothetical protein